jgi:hypothetical protein
VNNVLSKIIQNLIDLKKEGDYWDFKREKHTDNADLVHDIICLANLPNYSGERFLIFGVEDDYTLCGVESNEMQTQHNIIDTLKNACFAGGVFPDIRLEYIHLQGKNLEVLIIADKPKERPYYLGKEYSAKKSRGPQEKQERIVRAGTIYNRTRDTNTPLNGVASTTDIEKMWRQRFGLDLTPLERLETYLLDFDDWEEYGSEREGYWYHKNFPEFTIERTEDSKREVECHESWVRWAFAPNSEVYDMTFKYHQTILRV